MSNIVILGDTNVAYNLYFFISQNVIPCKNIIIGTEKFEFHPIVLEEVEAHTKAWILSKELGLKNIDLPSFFDAIQKDGLLKICKFVEDNLASVEPVVTDTRDFIAQRNIYEKIRLKLQKNMKAKGTVGKKITSVPSLNDYKILYSAQINNLKISTNDGILLEISKEILEDHNALKTEAILKIILASDPTKKPAIKESLNTLTYFDRILNESEIF